MLDLFSCRRAWYYLMILFGDLFLHFVLVWAGGLWAVVDLDRTIGNRSVDTSANLRLIVLPLCDCSFLPSRLLLILVRLPYHLFLLDLAAAAVSQYFTCKIMAVKRGLLSRFVLIVNVLLFLGWVHLSLFMVGTIFIILSRFMWYRALKVKFLHNSSTEHFRFFSLIGYIWQFCVFLFRRLLLRLLLLYLVLHRDVALILI